MKKVLLLESQLEMLVKHISEEQSSKQVIQEGWKDVVLGTAILMGIGLSGANAQTGKNALEDKQTLKKIEQTLEGPNIEKLADTLEKAGLTNAMDKIQANSEQIINAYNKAADKRRVDFHLTKVHNTGNVRLAKSKIKQGYAVQDIEVTKDTIVKQKGDIQVANELEMVFDANIVKSGTYDLADSIKTELEGAIESISMMGGKVTNIKIITSTDTEPISIGNDKLAKLRANGVYKFLNGLGVSVQPKIEIKPEQGPELDWSSMSSSEKKQAREETAEYRYVKVIIESVVEPAPQGEETVYEVVERVRYNLVKGYTTKRGIGSFKPWGGGNVKTKTFKCKKTKVKGVPMDCEFGFGTNN